MSHVVFSGSWSMSRELWDQLYSKWASFHPPKIAGFSTSACCEKFARSDTYCNVNVGKLYHQDLERCYSQFKFFVLAHTINVFHFLSPSLFQI